VWIMIAGPYDTGAKTGADREANLLALNRAAYQVFRRGHVPFSVSRVFLAAQATKSIGSERAGACLS
jgi:hypothetical protein